MRITGLDEKDKLDQTDREFLMEFDQLLGIKGPAQERFDELYREEIKSEPAIRTFRKVFLPLAFLVLDEMRELIIEKLAEEKIKEKVL